MILRELESNHLIHPPRWLCDNTVYLCRMGSEAYGVNVEGSSDCDLYGIAIPHKDTVFPHLRGEIQGFGRQQNRFEQFQQHHIRYENYQYDISVFNIVKFFNLVMENNPNVLDAIFVPFNCISYINEIGTIIRENRRLFLHKGVYYKLKGYAYSQVHKMKNKEKEGKRAETIEKFGYDVKFGYHVVRLLNECVQILEEHDLDLQRNAAQLKSIRRGEWTEQQIVQYFEDKEKELEALYIKSTLRNTPDEEAIKGVLLKCLEHHYGSLSSCLTLPDITRKTLAEIRELCDRALIS